MDDDPFEEECQKEQCANVRDNLKHMILASRKQASDLQSYSKLQANYEIVKHQLVATEALATSSTEKYNASVNAKEVAEAEVKQLQSTAEFHRRKLIMLEEQAEKAEQHKQQAIEWREKYDELARFCDTLNSKNEEVKEKYEGAVKTLSAVAKQMSSSDGQLKSLKTANTDLAGRQKKLDKYLKSAIRVIDALSSTANLSKHPKAIKDLVNVFRRDDVRLFFDTPPWKNSSSSEPIEDSSDHPDKTNNALPVVLNESSTTSMSDDGEPAPFPNSSEFENFDFPLDMESENDSEEDIERIEKSLKKVVKKAAKKDSPVKYLSGRQAKITTKTKEAKGRASAARMPNPITGKREPSGLQKGIKSSYIFNETPTIAKVDDFSAPSSGAGPSGASGASGAGATIHGRKGKTVREQQAEMMKESVKEKVARMKQQQEEKRNQKTSVEKPRHCMSEGSEDESDGEVAPKGKEAEPAARSVEPPMTRARLRSLSVHSRKSNTEKEAVSAQEQLMTRSRSRASKYEENTRQSRIDTRSNRQSITPARSMSRSERARARSVLRGDDEVEEQDEQATPQPVAPIEKSEHEALKERVKEARKRAPAPAPLDSGPPARSKTMMSVQAPKKKAQLEDVTSDEMPVLGAQEEIPSSSRLEAGFEPEDVTENAASSQEHSGVEKVVQEEEPSQAPAPAPDVVVTPEVPKISSEQSEGVIDVFNNEELCTSSPRYSPIVDEPDEMEASLSEVSQQEEQSNEPPVPAPTSTTSEYPSVKESPVTASDVVDSLTEPTEAPVSSDASRQPPKVIIPPEPEPAAKKPKLMLKSPNHEIICDLGLDISDSEDEEETPEAVPPSIPKEPEEPYNPYKPSQADAQRIRDPPPLTAVPKKSALRSTSKPADQSISTPPEPSFEDHQPDPTASDITAPDAQPLDSSDIVDHEPETGYSPTVQTPDSSRPTTPSVTKTDSELPMPSINKSPSKEPESFETLTIDQDSESSAETIERAVSPAKDPSSESTSSKLGRTQESQIPEVKNPVEVVSEMTDSSLSEMKSPEPTSSDISDSVNVKNSEKSAKVTPESVTASESDARSSDQPNSAADQAPSSAPEVEDPEALSSEFENPVRPKEKKASNKNQAISTKTEVAKSSTTSVRKPPAIKKAPEVTPKVATPSAPEVTPSTSEPVPEKQKLKTPIAKAPESNERVFKRRGESKTKPSAPPVKKIENNRVSAIQPPPSASDDLLGDILSGAKMPVKKAVKRPATSSKQTSETTTVPEPAKIQKPEPSTSSEPPAAKKFSAAKKPMVPIIEPVVKRARAKSIPKTAPEDGERRRGPRGKEKIANSLKAQLRQALDLKVGVHELKRLMEEKGIVLGDSIALEAADAADVMIGFLRETSAGDMWAVLKKQRTDGNCAPLNNTEEQNFLQVSVSLNEHDQELLELFIGRILSELAVRDTLDSRQLGRLSRLFCHSVRFADRPPLDKYEWMRRFTLLLLLKHPAHLAKSVAFCLISDSAEHCQWLVEQLLEHPDSSFSTAFRCLLHADPEVEGVVNWLLNSTFQLPRLTPPTPSDIHKAFQQASLRFLEMDSDEDVGEVLKESIYLAKTGQHGCLQMVFDMLKKEMEELDTQFIKPNEKEKELQHRTIYSLPTVPTKMTRGSAVELRRKFEWKKCVLSVITDNRHTDHWKAIMSALKQISPKIVTIRELLSTQSAEMFVEPDAIDDVRNAIEHMVEFIAEFTNYPLKSTILHKPTISTSSGAGAPSSSDAK